MLNTVTIIAYAAIVKSKHEIFTLIFAFNRICEEVRQFFSQPGRSWGDVTKDNMSKAISLVRGRWPATQSHVVTDSLDCWRQIFKIKAHNIQELNATSWGLEDTERLATNDIHFHHEKKYGNRGQLGQLNELGRAKCRDPVLPGQILNCGYAAEMKKSAATNWCTAKLPP